MRLILILAFLLPATFGLVKSGNFSHLYTVRDIEAEAKRLILSRPGLGPGAWTYLESGAIGDETIGDNVGAFRDWRIRPNYLVDVSSRLLNTTLLGSAVSVPIGASPSGLQRNWHPDGELATARAVQAAGSFMILSSGSTYTLEDVAQAAPSALKWYMSWFPNPSDRTMAEDIFRRVEAAGYAAIVFTVDMPVKPLRYSFQKTGFNVTGNGGRVNYDKYGGDTGLSNSNRITWEDLAWIKAMTKLPIVLKGIVTREDAREAVKAGVGGIIVSNHGGRQLDGSTTTLEALPEIVREVNGAIEVYLDGGIRSGKDVFRALALGARAVLVGRAIPWGLAVAGEEGVGLVLGSLTKELDSIMGQAGCPTLVHIHRTNVAHKMEYVMASLRH